MACLYSYVHHDSYHAKGLFPSNTIKRLVISNGSALWSLWGTICIFIRTTFPLPRLSQFYCNESLNPPGHTVTAAVLRTATKESSIVTGLFIWTNHQFLPLLAGTTLELVHLCIYRKQIYFVAIITEHCYTQQHVTVATKHALSVGNSALQCTEVYDKNTHNFPSNTHARTHDQRYIFPSKQSILLSSWLLTQNAVTFHQTITPNVSSMFRKQHACSCMGHLVTKGRFPIQLTATWKINIAKR